MRIIPYALEHADGVVRLLSACAERNDAIQALSRPAWMAFAARGFNRGARDFAVAAQDGVVVGLLTSTRLHTEDPPLRHFRVFVHPNRRCRGIGSALFSLVERQDAPGTATLQSNLPDGWGEGRRFLEHRGFRTARRHLEMERRGPAPDPTALPLATTLRPYAGIRDVESWRRLNSRGYADDPDRQELNDEDVVLLSGAPGFALWLAESEDGDLGLCHLCSDDAAAGRIESLVVAPSSRRRGIGRALLVHALRHLGEQGIDRATLGVAADNAAAVGLYRSVGFETVEGITTVRRP